jgi:hypothetical protein
MISLKAFINKTKGKLVDLNSGSTFGRLKGQCVSLIQNYLEDCYGIPFKARGNAKDWINTIPNAGIGKIVKTPKYGDIIVWGGYKRANGTTNKYGHIAIYINGKEYYDQFKGKACNYSSTSSPKSAIIGYLRINGTRIADEEEKSNSISNSIVKFNLKRLLKYNSKGNDVKELQKALGGLVIDGIFGAKTLSKVKSFQKSKKLYQDGIVGKNTAHALGWLYLNK